MDEIEFRKRICANPENLDQDILRAAMENPAYHKMLDESFLLELEIAKVIRNVSIPADLAGRLLAIPIGAGATAIDDTVVSKSASTNFFQYFAMPASLVLAIGIGAAVTLGGGPSPAEIAFGSEVIQHLYLEANEINSINDGTELSTVGVPAVVEVMVQADTQFNEKEFISSMPVRFAKPCVVLPGFQNAHLMLHGSRGAVNVIIIKNGPVATEYSIHDDRFQGAVVPMSKGNLMLIGEEDENLDEIKSLFAQNVSWTI